MAHFFFATNPGIEKVVIRTHNATRMPIEPGAS